MSNNHIDKPKSVAIKRLRRRILIIMALAMLIFSVTMLFTARMNIEETYRETMNSTGDLISGLVSDYMETNTKQLRTVIDGDEARLFLNHADTLTAYDEIKKAEGYTELQRRLDDICASSENVISAWVVSEKNGMLIADNGRFLSSDDYGLKNKYWYSRLASDTMTSKSVLYSSTTNSIFDTDIQAVSIISPVYSDGMLIGFCGLEINIEGVNSLLTQYSFGKGSYPVISSNFGTLIYSPSGESFKSSFNINKAPLVNILIHSDAYSDGVDSYVNVSGGNDYFYMNNSAVRGWSIIVLFESDEINGSIYGLFTKEVIILFCILCLAYIIIRNLVSYELSPLPEINVAVKKASSGNFTGKLEIDVRNELSEISDNFNALNSMLAEKTTALSKYINNDTLTGLPNRITLYDHIDRLIGSTGNFDEKTDKRFAVMFVDVDNFKWLNETLGHNFGDAVLCTFADVLRDTLNNDQCTVYRFSGDEFIIICEFGSDYDKIHTVIDKLQSAFDQPIRVMTDTIYLRFSMGVSIYPDDDITPDMLMRDADLALHKAKDNGKDRVSFYTNATQKHSFSKAALAQRITNALKNNELYLNYQPIISTETGDIHGFEVLLRWNNTDFGNIPPTEFISVAEETGAIIQIGTWIFESACRSLKNICENYRDDIIMSINVSPVQLKRPDYMEHVRRVIDITQVNPENIQIEITESTMIDFVDSHNSIVDQINEMGIAIALDDFGTGYSSLNYLKNFPIKCLKIDKSFVDEINNNKRDYAITDSIIDLVHGLGIRTVAEGIETVGQYNFLVDMKCDFIQGFLMSKPLDENDAVEFVKMYDALHKPDKSSLELHEKQLADEREEKLRAKLISENTEAEDEHQFKDSIISK